MSDRAWVGDALAVLAKGLKPFVQRHMSKTAAGDDWMEHFARTANPRVTSPSLADPSFLLRVIDHHWTQFSGQFPDSGRKGTLNLVRTLREERHGWAHVQPIARHDAEFVMSGIVKLLEAVDAVEAREAKNLLDEFNSAGNSRAEVNVDCNPHTNRIHSATGSRRTSSRAPVHAWSAVSSPLGLVYVAHHDQRVSALRVASNGDLANKVETGLSTSNWGVMDADEFIAFMRVEMSVDVEPEADPDRDPELMNQVRNALAVGLTDVPLDLSSLASAPFYQDALKATARIPRGEVRTYKDVAQMMGHPNAYRPVSEAMRRNPIPLLIPCHRVVHESFRTTRQVGKWGYGSVMKARLLASEGLRL